MRDAAKGRIARQSPKASASAINATQSRLNRKNNAKQAQLNKRSAIVSASRIFNGVDGAPRIVAVIPLSDDLDPRQAVQSLAGALDVDGSECPQDGLWKLRAERFKTSLQFRTVPYRSFYGALDACKVADYVVFVLSSTVEVDTWGDTLLRALQAQGMPEVITVASCSSSLDLKSRSGIMKSLLSFIQYFVPTQTRIFDLNVSSDSLNALRSLCEGMPSPIRWKEGRTWLLGEDLVWQDGHLSVTGVVRGSSLSANRLIHIPNFGDYQIAKILSAPNPRPGRSNMDQEPVLLAEPDPSSADSLVSSNDPDDLQNEQTWPTEEEMKGQIEDTGVDLPDANNGTTPKTVKRIPKGMSEYQASWIVDDDDVEDGDQEHDTQDENHVHEDDEEMEDMVIDDSQTEIDKKESVHFEDLDVEEEERQLEKWRNRKREEEDDASFPDEIDTPKDIAARTRFQRFRGMRSFRTSPWDPFENLPRDYARIFQFEDFKRTEHSVRRRAELEANIVEDPLILCVGPRRLNVTPIYTPELVAMGSFLNPDTTRIIAKRVILTGHPFKVHKKTATIRYMFFNADDVHYFKPIQLHTKHGRTGHIRESLGTHGYFKAHFDGPINQMDTVCMSLYKRVYPKWASLWKAQTTSSANNAVLNDAMEE
ncbi:hypothetical protein CVT24_004569 [Panaeolus cyanescens]|uniref:Bms1-type G domain-containing protein n=1 Tax=Panaeolus cyanescens TaxID=181874 RepID=A0A409VA36_9AGAR|nr:hypothetical protein CVT24_004569 [Panaeolus cyanescens]